jgi:hypothetical protein
MLHMCMYTHKRTHTDAYQFFGAIVLTATKSKRAGTPAITACVFAWMLVIMSAISAFLASRSHGHYDKYDESYLGGNDDRTSSVRGPA